MAVPNIKYNDININLIPNPQYLQQGSSFAEEGIDEVINLTAQQIYELEIFKSFDTHLTEVRLKLMNLNNTVQARLSEGKYILQISISPGKDPAKNDKGFKNYFLCDKLIANGPSKTIGTYPTNVVILDLKSVLRQRLEIENFLAFELGGKGNKSISGMNEAPIQFLTTTLNDVMTMAYTPTGTSASGASAIFDMTLTSDDPSVVVSSGPDSGYKIETDTNLDALGFFFDNYPLFKTPYGWLVDDFVTSDNSQPSMIKIHDFLRKDTWKANVNKGLSNFLSGKFDGPQSAAQSYKFTDLGKTKITSFYNGARYLFRDSFPLIYAKNIYNGTPLPMNNWNTLASSAYVLTTSNSAIEVKSMPNPMYSYYLTFMNEIDITQTQRYKALFFNMHPELITYSLDNLWVGDIDMDTCLNIPRASLPEEASYGYDRIGSGYQMRFKYTRVKSTPAIQEDVQNKDGKEGAIFPERYKLSAECTFLFIDDSSMDLNKFNEVQPKGSAEVFNSNDINTYPDIFGCGGNNPIDLGDIPTAEPGSPGNGSIAQAGKTLIDHGFVYLWGGDRRNAMDCSAFTMYAVRNSGADRGRKRRYPNGTDNQLTWLLDKNNGAAVVTSKDQIQAGDIVFFKTSRGDHGHTAIAASNQEYYHSNSVGEKGADIGSFARRSPSYIFRLNPFNNT